MLDDLDHNAAVVHAPVSPYSTTERTIELGTCDPGTFSGQRKDLVLTVVQAQAANCSCSCH